MDTIMRVSCPRAKTSEWLVMLFWLWVKAVLLSYISRQICELEQISTSVFKLQDYLCWITLSPDNVRSNSFFNRRQFRTQCAMALSLKRCARSNQNHLRDCCNVCFEFCFMFKFSCLLFWSLVMVPFSHVILLPSCNPGAHSSSDPTFCYGFRVERHVSWKRCGTVFEIRFSCLVCLSKMSAQSEATCI